MAELVEAWSRSGRLNEARQVAERFGAIAEASGTAWAAGVLNRTKALVAGDDTAEDYFLEAIRGFSETSARLDLARANLLYGEWLRRRRRLVDARARLSAAHESFASMGAGAFAARALGELAAAGVTAQSSTAQPTGLSPQESHIVRLARQGLTNSEIAARLFISPRTVEYHLSKVFIKLGIRSRHDLRRGTLGEGQADEST
jgi:DNA-binding CsgD family transcriptional regulator